jgi:FkbM family methyltransferase
MTRAFSLPNKASLRKRVESALRLQLVGGSFHGHRDCTDIERSGCRVSVVFDVGANVGQSADKFGAAFPNAHIHSFEPASGTFLTLTRHVTGRANVSCHHLALGSSDGRTTLYLTGASDVNSVTNSLMRPPNSVGEETVELRTIDSFASEHGIPRIDLLKIDAEGADLEVLVGARTMLASQKVAFVLTEVGFHPGDARHVLFDDVRSYLLPLGFSVFGIYDQQPEWSGEQRLRFANVCFSNERAFPGHISK